MAVSPDDFRRALGSFASGVSVVTCLDAQGQPRGMTVSALASISLVPPLVLVSIDLKASLEPLLAEGHELVINILAADQQSLSRRFASREEDRFADLAWTPAEHGAPRLDGALATIDGHVVARYPGGDHTLVLAEVDRTEVRDGRPLCYFRGQYVGVGPLGA